ncbi:MAG: hypothetical protein P8X95_22515 [Anaerolineales bacterium]
MNLFRFGPGTSRRIEPYESRNMRLARIARLTNVSTISCIYVEAEGAIEHHRAAGEQLFWSSRERDGKKRVKKFRSPPGKLLFGRNESGTHRVHSPA